MIKSVATVKPVLSSLPVAATQEPAANAAPERARNDEESLGYLIRQAHRAFVKALAETLEPHGISPGEWSAMRALWLEEGLTQVELADRMRVEKASLTGVLNSLEAKKLIQRVRNLQDRRKINLRLTAAGRRLETRVLGSGFAINEIAGRDVPPGDLDEFRRLLHRMVDNLDGARLKR